MSREVSKICAERDSRKGIAPVLDLCNFCSPATLSVHFIRIHTLAISMVVS
jgi:hypothetical protein